MNRINLSDRSIQKLHTVLGKRSYISDEKVKGLELQITEKGTKTFYLRFWRNGTCKRKKIGKWEILGIERARKIALKLLLEELEGSNITTKELSLQEIVDEYLKFALNNKSHNTYKFYESVRKNISKDLLSKDFNKIGVDEAHTWFDSIESKSTANGVLALITASYNYFEKRGLLKFNPFKRITKHKISSRSDFIKPENLKDFIMKCLHSGIDGESALCLLFTGLRINSITCLTWQDITPEGKIHISDSKNKMKHDVFIHPFLMMRINSRRAIGKPFSSYTKIYKSLGDMIPHTLRHTFTTYARAIIKDVKLLDLMTGHKTQSVTINVYAHVFDDELRDSYFRVVDFMLDKSGFGSEKKTG